jgi:hypothetical protein
LIVLISYGLVCTPGWLPTAKYLPAGSPPFRFFAIGSRDLSVGAARLRAKTMQRFERTRGSNFEDRAAAAASVGSGRPVEDSVIPLKQSRGRSGAIRAI